MRLKNSVHALRLDPKQIKTYLNLATIHLMNKETAVAEKVYRDALAVDPQAVETYLALGTFYTVQKRLPEAEAQFRQAITLQPGDVGLYIRLANFCMVQNKFSDAETMYREAASIAPQDPHPYLALDAYVATRKSCKQSLLTKGCHNCPGLPAAETASRTVLVAKCPGRCSVYIEDLLKSNKDAMQRALS